MQVRADGCRCCRPFRSDPGQFVETRGLAELPLQLRDLADVVLIDSPSLLTASRMTLSSVVDGFVLIAALALYTAKVERVLTCFEHSSSSSVSSHRLPGRQQVWLRRLLRRQRLNVTAASSRLTRESVS